MEFYNFKIIKTGCLTSNDYRFVIDQILTKLEPEYFGILTENELKSMIERILAYSVNPQETFVQLIKAINNEAVKSMYKFKNIVNFIEFLMAKFNQQIFLPIFSSETEETNCKFCFDIKNKNEKKN